MAGGGEFGRKVVQVQHAGIIKTPLQQIVGNEARGLHRRAAGSGDGLLAVGEPARAGGVGQGHFAVEDGHGGLFDAVDRQHGHDEFRALDAGGAAARQHANASLRTAVEKGKHPADEMQAVFVLGGFQRADLDFRLRLKTHDILAGDVNAGGAVGAHPDPVEGIQRQVGERGRRPVGGAAPQNIDVAVDLHDADRVVRLRPGRAAREQQRAQRQQQDDPGEVRDA